MTSELTRARNCQKCGFLIRSTSGDCQTCGEKYPTSWKSPSELAEENLGLRRDATVLRETYARSIKGLMILQERPDLTKAAGIRPGDYIGDAVPYLVAEIDRMRAQIDAITTAVVAYVRSEGCGCCSDHDKHSADQRALGVALGALPYSDGSGYDIRALRPKKGDSD